MSWGERDWGEVSWGERFMKVFVWVYIAGILSGLFFALKMLYEKGYLILALQIAKTILQLIFLFVFSLCIFFILVPFILDGLQKFCEKKREEREREYGRKFASKYKV